VLYYDNVIRSYKTGLKLWPSMNFWYYKYTSSTLSESTVSIFLAKCFKKKINKFKTNKKLDELIKHWNIINYVKAKRLS